MATRRVVHSRSVVRGNRRRTAWAHRYQTLAVGAAVVRDNLLTDFNTSNGILANEGYTVLRVLGTLNARQNAAATPTPMVSFGFIVEDSGMPAQGPQQGGVSRDWMGLLEMCPINSGTPQDTQVYPVWGRTFDLRSKRRITDIQERLEIYLDQGGGASSFTVAFATHVLLALP